MNPSNKGVNPPWWASEKSKPTECDTVRRHTWVESNNSNKEYTCSVCGVAVDEFWFRDMDVASDLNDLSLDVALWIWTTNYPYVETAKKVKKCPRYT